MKSKAAWLAILSAAAIAACVAKTAEPVTTYDHRTGGGGGAGGEGVTVETVTDDSGREYHISQGVAGDPSTVGCADGQREAFVDASAYPSIAGCMGSWEGTASLRAAPTGAACGDDGGTCASPADVCAPGWHVCAADGSVSELRAISGEECFDAGGGRFSAGISHCMTQDGCQYDASASASYPCFESGWCSEPVCCGSDCGEFGVCTGGVWENATHIPVGTDQGCAAVHSDRAGGILCCR